MGRLALSVRQPYAEQILCGVKVFEYRTRPTRVRGRVYIYAAQRVQEQEEEWAKVGMGRDDVVRGRIVGSVEIVACEWDREKKHYQWHLARPRRMAARLPRRRPQPVWFYPF